VLRARYGGGAWWGARARIRRVRSLDAKSRARGHPSSLRWLGMPARSSAMARISWKRIGRDRSILPASRTSQGGGVGGAPQTGSDVRTIQRGPSGPGTVRGHAQMGPPSVNASSGRDGERAEFTAHGSIRPRARPPSPRASARSGPERTLRASKGVSHGFLAHTTARVRGARAPRGANA